MKYLTQTITDYPTACKHLNRNELTIEDFKFLPPSQQENAFARHVLLTAIESLNDGWVADYMGYDQDKYEIYGYNNKSGFSFYVNDCYYACYGGSDFAIKSREIANHIIKHFEPQLKVIYK